jgi:hypothetical protein
MDERRRCAYAPCDGPAHLEDRLLPRGVPAMSRRDGFEKLEATMNRSLALALVAACVLFQPATAHEPFVEEEMARRVGRLQPDEDFSFANPFEIPGSIEESRAVFSFLHSGDVDVFRFTVTPDQIGYDPYTGMPTPLVSASALPPACAAYGSAYPVTALVGYGLPAPDPGLELPFDLLPGQGVVFADNPPIAPGTARPVFNFPEADYAWFLPDGLTEQCLLYAPWTCDFSNTISTPVFVPGDYFLVMWNPTGQPMDYTANIGFREDLFQGPADTPEKIAARARAETITPMIERFKMNRMPCNQVPLH